VNVSGIGFASVDNTISAENGSPDVNIKVKRANEPDGTIPGAVGASISATDLAIPAKAQKEFDNAQKLIDRQDFKKAIQTLNHAIAIYPAYAGAYNNLGVVYARTGDHDKEREALEKAISINDHFAPAYVNLGRLDISKNDYAGAEQELSKATSYDPTDAMTLVLLTYSEFMDKHFDLAIANARRAHSLQGEHAFSHQVAARAYEQKRDGRDAIAELQLFLKEEPTGQRADTARKELSQLEAIVAKSAVRAQ
jgi:tetratricopeptide (TPR) repeat protein